MKTLKYFLFLFISLFLFGNCKQSPETSLEESTAETFDLVLPDWAKSATIYEVNVRQFSDEGSFNEVTKALPRIKKMGADILWFMPIFPISETKRKGTLGSYYAVSDFISVNPQFGTMSDFENLIDVAHSLGMKVILDWVPNHTGWDHKWITAHPDFYSQDSDGNIIDPVDPQTGKSWGWTDVADLNYDNMEMRKAMVEDLLFWVTQKEIDGFRMDVAHSVPLDFWTSTTPILMEKNKDLFLLAEAESEELVNDQAFHAGYGWNLHHRMNAVAKGEKNATYLWNWFENELPKFTDGFHMHFTSNHDENSWSGTVFERMGDSHKAFAVLSATIEGTPLVYSGQEEPLRKRLEFFEKDPIGFDKLAYEPFYTTILNLKHRNAALWNGEFGGKMNKLASSDDVFAFTRIKDGDQIMAIFNLSAKPQNFVVPSEFNNAKEIFSGEEFTYKEGDTIDLAPWTYLVYSNK